MPDIFLRSGATPSKDITLRDPTSADAGGVVAKSDADTLALADAATNILLATPDDPLSLNDVATIVALLTPAEAMSAADAATLIALAGLDEPISATDTATLVSLMTPTDSGTMADAATLIGLAAAESAAVLDAVTALVVTGAGDSFAITDQAAALAVGTPDEAIAVSEAVVDLLQFQTVGPLDEALSLLDAVLSIVEIKELPTATPAFGGPPSTDTETKRRDQLLKTPKVKRVPLDYEPAPLPQAWAFPFPPDLSGRHYVRLNNRIGDLLALYMMGLIDFEELNTMAAAAQEDTWERMRVRQS